MKLGRSLFTLKTVRFLQELWWPHNINEQSAKVCRIRRLPRCCPLRGFRFLPRCPSLRCRPVGSEDCHGHLLPSPVGYHLEYCQKSVLKKQHQDVINRHYVFISSCTCVVNYFNILRCWHIYIRKLITMHMYRAVFIPSPILWFSFISNCTVLDYFPFTICVKAITERAIFDNSSYDAFKL